VDPGEEGGGDDESAEDPEDYGACFGFEKALHVGVFWGRRGILSSMGWCVI
jgi:hypothetical protein